MPSLNRLLLTAGAVTLTVAGLLIPRFIRSDQTAVPASSSTSALQDAPPAGFPPAMRQTTNSPAAIVHTKTSRLISNPYAAALRQPGKSKRAWDPEFIDTLKDARSGDPVQVPLTAERVARGTVNLVQHRRVTPSDSPSVVYVSGTLTQPEAGRFFILRPPEGGKAGSAVAVFEFPASQTAYRVEPTGHDGAPELWERRLDEVICLSMPEAEAQQPNAAEIPPLRPDLVPDFVPSWNSNIVSLQSFPGSPAVLLLDFFGGYTPTWGGVTYPRPSVSNAQIKDVWKRVAEDFMPFNINVTTDRKVYEEASPASRQRCVFTPSTSAVGSGAAGVAYIGSWNWGNDTVCWSVYTTGKNGAEVGAHEPGHTLGLNHQGTASEGYYGGHGSGAVGWAPIMGVGYYQPVSAWAKGEYLNANNTDDELNIVVSNNNAVNFRNDDTGDVLAVARHLELFPGNSAFAEGVIERTGDSDAFRFTTSGGTATLSANPVGDWANLGVFVTLVNSNGVSIASNQPAATLSGSVSVNLAPGTYTFRVTGSGRNNPLTSGFSSYGSLGYYSVTGNVAGARLPARFSIAENTPNGTTVGTIAAVNPNADPLIYSITSGNTGNTFALNNSGALTVANNSLLNYESLAQTNFLGVQFELFVNITNTVNPALNELGRRVVVVVTNVNERPALSTLSVKVIEATSIGTAIGQVSGSDPDYSTALSFSIASGNNNGAFAIDPASGLLTVAGNLNAATQNAYSLAVVLSDQAVPSPLTSTSIVAVTVIPNATPFRPGSIGYTVYEGISNSTVAALTNALVFPRDPAFERQVSLFEGDLDRGENYGAVMRGYIIPPATGTYTFWIASDDSSELRLSTSTNPATANVIASVSGYTSPREWTKFSSQQSAGVPLTAGQGYYVEVRVKEATGGDHVAVAWQCTSAGITREVIPGRFLAPFFMNYTPRVSGFTYKLHKDAIEGSRVGSIVVSDVNSGDTHSFVLLSGNLDGIFGLETNTGVLRVVNEAALRASSRSSYSLQVRAVDNGSPELSNSTTVTVSLLTSNALNVSSVRQEVWNNMGGTALSDLTSHSRWPAQPDALNRLTAMNGAIDTAENYGSRIRAALTTPGSGTFTFFLSSDDASQLKLSTNGNPADAVVIASVSGWTPAGVWNNSPSQKSAPIPLVAGQTYYIETIHKEGGGGDHVQVAWAGPGLTGTNFIADAFISPVDLNYPPLVTNQSAVVPLTATNGTTVAIVSASDSPLDLLAYKIVSGNVSNAFAIDADSGKVTLANRSHLPFSAGMYVLRFQVQDSGYAGLFPLRTAEATLTIRVTGANWPPTVALVTPTNGALVGAPLLLRAAASDPDGNLNHVEFYANGALVGQALAAPFQITWSSPSVGIHTVHARAVDAQGSATTTASSTIQVVPATAATLIPAGDTWRYFDDGSNQGTAWRTAAFDDRTWKSGPAELGYGDGDEATIVNSGLSVTNRYVTTYFRRAIYVHTPSGFSTLAARYRRDDGAVVYLNGSEIFRSNMPTGVITHLTLASLADDDGKTWFTNDLNPAALVAGTNVIAVELHQNSLSSSDLSFDLSLTGMVLMTNGLPKLRTETGDVLALTWPADAQYFSVVQATNIGAASWLPVTNKPVLVNGEWRVAVPRGTNTETYFKLHGK